MLHPLACRCGSLAGTVETAAPHNRIVCYCADCQAYARQLGREDILDDRGGSDVLQTVPSAVRFSQGAENLACLRMTKNGPLRFYAACCNTPVVNTGTSHKLVFAGLLSACLGGSGPDLDRAFGPVRMFGFTAGAKGEPKPPQTPLPALVLRLLGRGLKERLAGRHRRNPFFDVTTDTPIVPPKPPVG